MEAEPAAWRLMARSHPEVYDSFHGLWAMTTQHEARRYLEDLAAQFMGLADTQAEEILEGALSELQWTAQEVQRAARDLERSLRRPK